MDDSVALKGATVAAIGTSLMGRGLDARAALLGLSPDTQRLAQPSMTADRALTIAEASLAQGASLVVIEAQPFLRQLGRRNLLTWGAPLDHWRRTLDWQVAIPLRRRLYRTLGHSLRIPVPSPWLKDRETEPVQFLADPEVLARAYPPRLIDAPHPERLAALIEQAKRQDAGLLFVALPISEHAASYIGPEYREEFGRHLKEFAERFAVEAWSPAYSWSDDHFTDQAHMNAKGRARFTRELRAHLTYEPT